MQGICVPFVVVGHVAEPRVAFAKPSINFARVLIGRVGKSTVEIVNSEDAPFDFTLDRATYDATDDVIAGRGKPPVVTFEPTHGLVPANGSVAIQASYRPDGETLVNYTVACRIARKPTALTLNVKGEGYAVHEHLCLETPEGKEVELSPTVRTTMADLVQSCPC